MKPLLDFVSSEKIDIVSSKHKFSQYMQKKYVFVAYIAKL